MDADARRAYTARFMNDRTDEGEASNEQDDL